MRAFPWISSGIPSRTSSKPRCLARNSPRATALPRTGPSSRCCPAAATAKWLGIFRRSSTACEILAHEIGDDSAPQFVHAVASGLGLARSAPSGADSNFTVKRIEGETYNALAAADCAIVASGTATVEAALLGTPMVVVYRVAPLTAFILRRMVHTPFFSMVNLVAGTPRRSRAYPGRFHTRRRRGRGSPAAGFSRGARGNEGSSRRRSGAAGDGRRNRASCRCLCSHALGIRARATARDYLVS